MKGRAIPCGLLSAWLLSAVVAAGGDIPGKVVLRVYPKRPVAFDHKAHAERVGQCRKCHHQDDPGSEVKCSECHQPKREGGTPSFREAMHRRCRNCHADDRKKVKGTCIECHPEIKPAS